MSLKKESVENLRQPNRGEYVPDEDVTQKTPDGREYVVARKGVPMMTAEAERLGLIGDNVAPALGSIQTPVGNTLLTEEVENSGAAKDNPQLQASIAEVEKVQKGKTPKNNKAAIPEENK